MAPKLKLYYFDMTGRAEPIRLILAAGQVPYEDCRFAREDWPKLKTGNFFWLVFCPKLMENLKMKDLYANGQD